MTNLTLCLLFISSLFIACAPDGKPVEKEAKKKMISENNSYEINRDTALLAINSYHTYVDSATSELNGSPSPFLNANPEERLIYGVQVNRAELYQVLEARPTDSLYVMIGTKPNGETEFFFSLKSEPNLKNINPLDNWDFFDFTRPCPNACPSFVVHY